MVGSVCLKYLSSHARLKCKTVFWGYNSEGKWSESVSVQRYRSLRSLHTVQISGSGDVRKDGEALEALMLDQKETSDSPRDVACRWLLNHEEWQDWLPGASLKTRNWMKLSKKMQDSCLKLIQFATCLFQNLETTHYMKSLWHPKRKSQTNLKRCYHKFSITFCWPFHSFLLIAGTPSPSRFCQVHNNAPISFLDGFTETFLFSPRKTGTMTIIDPSSRIPSFKINRNQVWSLQTFDLRICPFPHNGSSIGLSCMSFWTQVHGDQWCLGYDKGVRSL